MKSSLVVLFLALFCPVSVAQESSANRLFTLMKGFEGEWRIAEPTRDTVVSFEVIANGTALVEKWTMSPTRKSMTIYAMDGNELLVTHYCPQGNAPRLRFDRVGENGVYYFSFVDGLNLQDKTGSHQHAFWMSIVSGDEFVRGETYIKNGAEFQASDEQNDPQRFRRVPQSQ